MRFPLLSKVAALAAVMVVLLVALNSVDSLVHERQMRQREAEHGLAESLAGQQTLLGPVMRMQCDETWERAEGEGSSRKTVTERREHTVTAWPRTLNVQASALIEPRYRGLFKLNGYLAKHQVSAQWDPIAAPAPGSGQPGARIACQAPTIALALGDARGIRSAAVRVEGRELPVQPGSLLKAQPHGFHVRLPEQGSVGVPVQMQLTLELAGTRGLAWVPVGQDTQVQLASTWPHPSFGGRFLPVDRQVSGSGFQAQWKVSGLATTARQVADAGGAVCAWHEDGGRAATAAEGGRAGCVDAFGVSFIDPVNGYLLSERAVKYGLLFIVLTFVSVALVEVMRRLRVHPIQYLLVGCALTVFFLLLLSLGEHLPFGTAYAIAGVACTALLAFYGAHVLGGLRPGLAFGGGIALLYAALYALLQMEQTALVLGSMLMFAVLAAVMVATRRIDWYALAAQARGEAGVQATPPTQAATSATQA